MKVEIAVSFAPAPGESRRARERGGAHARRPRFKWVREGAIAGLAGEAAA